MVCHVLHLVPVLSFELCLCLVGKEIAEFRTDVEIDLVLLSAVEIEMSKYWHLEIGEVALEAQLGIFIKLILLATSGKEQLCLDTKNLLFDVTCCQAKGIALGKILCHCRSQSVIAHAGTAYHT